MKRKEEGNGRAGGSQVNESNKSFRSQWSGEVNLGFDVQFVKKKVGMVSHSDRKWRCKRRHNHDEWPTI